MSLFSDELVLTELKVGTRVRHKWGYKGTVLRIGYSPHQSRLYFVHWDDRDITAVYGSCIRSKMTLLCPACDYPKEAHTDEGKCFYGPGQWRQAAP